MPAPSGWNPCVGVPETYTGRKRFTRSLSPLEKLGRAIHKNLELGSSRFRARCRLVPVSTMADKKPKHTRLAMRTVTMDQTVATDYGSAWDKPSLGLVRK